MMMMMIQVEVCDTCDVSVKFFHDYRDLIVINQANIYIYIYIFVAFFFALGWATYVYVNLFASTRVAGNFFLMLRCVILGVPSLQWLIWCLHRYGVRWTFSFFWASANLIFYARTFVNEIRLQVLFFFVYGKMFERHRLTMSCFEGFFLQGWFFGKKNRKFFLLTPIKTRSLEFNETGYLLNVYLCKIMHFSSF